MPARVSAALQATLQRAHDAMQAAEARTSPEALGQSVRTIDVAAWAEAWLENQMIDFASAPAFAMLNNTIPEEENEVPTLGQQIPLTEEDAAPAPELRQVAINNIIVPAPIGNPSASFIENVRQLGVLQPIILREVVRGADDTTTSYAVVAGTRRLAAADACGMEMIPALVYPPMTAVRVQASAALSENMQRSSNVVRDVDMIGALIATGENWNDVRERLHLSESQMSRRAALLNLSSSWRTIFRARRMATATATLLARRSQSEQRQIYNAIAIRVDMGSDRTTTVTSRMVREAIERFEPSMQPSIQLTAEGFGSVATDAMTRWTTEQVQYATRLMGEAIIMDVAPAIARSALLEAVRHGVVQVANYVGVEPDMSLVSLIVTNGSAGVAGRTPPEPTRYERVGNGRVPIGNEQPVDDPDDVVPVAVPGAVVVDFSGVTDDEGWAAIIELLERAEAAIPADGEEITDDFGARLNRLLTDANEGRHAERVAAAPVVTPVAAAAALNAQDTAAAGAVAGGRFGEVVEERVLPITRRRELGAISENAIELMIDAHVRNGAGSDRGWLRAAVIAERRGELARHDDMPIEDVNVSVPAADSPDRRVIFSINEES